MKYPVSVIRGFVEELLMKVGLSEENAKTCTDVLITADLRGQRSHGTTHLAQYVRRFEIGTTSMGGELDFTLTSPSTYVVDAHYALGSIVAPTIMKKCIEQAKVAGMCFVSVTHGNHYGLGGYYPMMAAKENMIGFSFANTRAMVAPFGGAEPLLGTNPVSIAIPAGRYPDLVYDIATSMVAKGQIDLAIKEGRSIPEGWALDPDGCATTDPQAADKGVLLPFGAHKGYGIMLIVSILSFALSGADMDFDIPSFFAKMNEKSNGGYFMGCLDIARFTEVDAFKARVDAMFDALKACRPSAGSRGVMIPGEIEYERTARGLAEGIDMSEAVLKEFKSMADKYGIVYPF